MNATRAALTLTLAALLGDAVLRPSRTEAQQSAPQELPPISYVCPMPQDEVNQGEPGFCPICGMALVPVRLDLAFTCPNHPAVIQPTPGLCPLDRRELVQVTVALHWQCPENPRQHFTEPGRCGDGSERRLVRELRAHGDHNPRHGGLFFMAADKWHHLEGTHPAASRFRMYLYDNFTRPIEPKGMTGRLALLDENNNEVGSAPLRVSPQGQTLDATVGKGALPLRVAAFVKFDDKTPEQRFDFVFPEYSKEPAPKPVATTTTATPAAPPASAPAPAVTQAPGVTPAPAAAGAAGGRTAAALIGDCTTMSRTDVSQIAQSLPSTPPELLTLLGLCTQQVEKLIGTGEFGFLYIPTMVSKDIALALEDHVSELPASKRAEAMMAVRRLVLSAWQVDYYGDTGNRERLIEAFDPFMAAVASVKATYGGQQ
jgi:hypothetical protein